MSEAGAASDSPHLQQRVHQWAFQSLGPKPLASLLGCHIPDLTLFKHPVSSPC